ncbi:MAG: prolyl oligopeptidase family serine peptidase [bacterium]|jgi:dienelactone hydrolase
MRTLRLIRSVIAINAILALFALQFAGIAFAALPALEYEMVPASWRVLGPFETGSRESGTDPTWLADGSHLDVSEAPPDFAKTYPSVLAAGGQAGWTGDIATGEGGKLSITLDLPDDGWEMRMDEWGHAGIAWRGYAYADVTAPRACRAVALANGVGGFAINGRSYQGDPYGSSRWLQPVVLDEGVNRILVGLSGYMGEEEITFKLQPPPAEPCGVIESDILVPDLVNYTTFEYYAAGVPVVNYTDEWQTVSISLGPVEGLGYFQQYADSTNIPPLGVLKIPMQAKMQDSMLGYRWKGSEVEAPLELSGEGWSKTYSVKFRVRRPNEAFRTTYNARVDFSAQKLSVLPPLNFDPEKKYALIFSTHGAGVDSDSQVGAYSQKDWAYVMAPTNRREFGFDWQDWGRLDAMESLAWAFRNFNIDEDRVILTGHSMGGHGCWHIGCTQPDLFAAMVPSAGWASFQLYTPYTMRSSEIFGPPEVLNILDKCNAPDRTELLLANLMNVPVMAVHGGADDNVPATHARLLVGELQKMGYDAKLWEVPGEGHWWDSSPDTPGADCVDAPEITEFMKDKKRDWTDEVVFAGYDMANSNGSYWIHVLGQEKYGDQTRVKAKYIYSRESITFDVNGNVIWHKPFGATIETSNVSALRLDIPENSRRWPFKLFIDGQKLAADAQSETAIAVKENGTWRIAPDYKLLPKYAERSGPIKRAYMRPFIVVDLSNGTRPRSLELCRNTAIRWWYRGNGYAPVKYWSELSEADKKRNLILVGTWDDVPEDLKAALPFNYDEHGVRLGDKFISGDGLAVEMVYPSPYGDYNLILVNIAADEDALAVCSALTPLYSGSSLPDFLVADRAGIARHGLAGAKALGFFDADWNYDDSLMYADTFKAGKYPD